ncbi:MAG: DoxX family protein [Rhizomicrobium sp.]|nr:DoxX family protein [Rhizomicrobium sp.]
MADDLSKLLLRLGVGGLMLFHGVHTLLTGLDPLKAILSAHGLPEALAYIAYFGEIIGPGLVLIGIFARVGAGLIALEIVALIALGGLAQLVSLSPGGAYGLETELLYLFGALAIVIGGGGKYGLARHD